MKKIVTLISAVVMALTLTFATDSMQQDTTEMTQPEMQMYSDPNDWIGLG